MLFIYPNGPKSTNENMLGSLFYMPFIFLTDRIYRMAEKEKRRAEKKKNVKNTHKLTHTLLFPFWLVLWSVQRICWVFIPAFVCGMQAGNLLFICVFFFFAQIYHQTFIVVQVSSRLPSCYVPSTLQRWPEQRSNNNEKNIIRKWNALHRKTGCRRIFEQKIYVWRKRKKNDISLAPDYRIEIIRFVVVVPFPRLIRHSPYFDLHSLDFCVRFSMSAQLITHKSMRRQCICCSLRCVCHWIRSEFNIFHCVQITGNGIYEIKVSLVSFLHFFFSLTLALSLRLFNVLLFNLESILQCTHTTV